MKIKLQQIAEIRNGYLERRRKPDAPKVGSYKLLQIKDISPQHELKLDALMSIDPPNDVSQFLVRKNDVLFISRGQRNVAVCIDESYENLIASYSLYIVRLKTDKVLPQYLAWYICQPKAQQYIKENLHGSYIKMLPKSLFEEITIVAPSPEVQKKIVSVAYLHKKEEDIETKLMELKGQVVRRRLYRAVLK